MEAATTDRLDLGTIATLVQDLFYQDYPGRDAFIDAAQIQPLIGMAYARMINDDYKTAKMLNKSLTGFSAVELSSDWLESEDVELKRNNEGAIVGKLSRRVFAFDYDSMNSGIQTVQPIGSDCGQLVRVSVNDRWKFCKLPFTDKVFVIVDGAIVEVLSKGCYPERVRVRYVPAVFPVDENFAVAATKADDLVHATLQLLLIAKNGVIVDKTNNSNPNVLPQTEIDADSLGGK